MANLYPGLKPLPMPKRPAPKERPLKGQIRAYDYELRRLQDPFRKADK